MPKLAKETAEGRPLRSGKLLCMSVEKAADTTNTFVLFRQAFEKVHNIRLTTRIVLQGHAVVYELSNNHEAKYRTNM